jgi:hypothetical protein
LTPLFGHHQRITRRDDNIDSDIAARGIRIPQGHPEGYLEGFATVYSDIAEVLQAKRDGKTVDIQRWIPGIETGVEGLKFISAVIASSEADSRWTEL